MQIRCPECQLERKIDVSSIPGTAVMATCPQCKARFRFRTLVGDQENATLPTQTTLVAPATLATPVTLTPTLASSATPSVSKIPVAPVAPVAPEALASISTTKPAPTIKPASTTDHDSPEPAARPVDLSGAGKIVQPGASERETAENLLRKQAGATDEPAATEWHDVPWERPERYGHLMGMYHTIMRVLFNAPRFFSILGKCRGSIMRPLLFYVLLGLFQTLVKLVWFQSVAPSVTDPQVQELLSSTDMSLALTLVVAPGILAVQLFFYTALFFLMLRLVQPEQVVFATVLRVVAYSSAPMVVCAIPVLGPIVGLLWFAACCFMGCRFALNLQWHKVALALVPLYLIGFVITMQFVAHLLQQG